VFFWEYARYTARSEFISFFSLLIFKIEKKELKASQKNTGQIKDKSVTFAFGKGIVYNLADNW
jgi:hypothetical protein